MKTPAKIHLLRSALMLCIAALISGCSRKADDLLAIASASDMIVAEIDAAKIYENAGCAIGKDGQPSLTPALMSLAQALDMNFIEAKGVALGSIVVSVRDASSWAVAFSVTDAAAFKGYLRSLHEGFSETEEEGYSVYRFSPSKAVYVRGNVGCLFSTGYAPSGVAELEAYKAASAADPLKPWQAKALDGRDAINAISKISALEKMSTGFIPAAQLRALYDSDLIENGYFRLACSLSGLELKGEGVFTDAEGNTIKAKADTRVDASLLRFAGADELMAVLLAMPAGFDWAEAIERVAEIPIFADALADTEARQAAADVLATLDGTLMVAAGPKSMMCMQSTDEWAASIAMQPRKGEADECVAKIKALLGRSAANCSVEVAGGNVVVSFNKPLSEAGGFAIPASELKGYSAVLAFDIPRANVFSPLLDFPFGLRCTYGTDGTTLTLSATLTECEGLFLENIANFISGEEL